MLYWLAIILSISYVYASDYCAWNRAAKPIDDNADTYNFINGEYTRDQTYTTFRQSALWQGMPYYKSTNGNKCYISELWMYRHTDINVYPPVHTWVISAAMGAAPEYGFAYCGPDETPMISDLNSPLLCDGKWKVGKPASGVDEGSQVLRLIVIKSNSVQTIMRIGQVKKVLMVDIHALHMIMMINPIFILQVVQILQQDIIIYFLIQMFGNGQYQNQLLMVFEILIIVMNINLAFQMDLVQLLM